MIRSTLRHIWKQCLRYRPYNKKRQTPQSPPAAVGSTPHLPDELLGAVFGYLVYDHQIRLRRVCQRWRCILRSPLVQQQIIFRNLHGLDWDLDETADQQRQNGENNTEDDGANGNENVVEKVASATTRRLYSLKEYTSRIQQSILSHQAPIKVIIFDGQQRLADRFKASFLATDRDARCSRELNDYMFEGVYLMIIATLLALYKDTDHLLIVGTRIVIKFVNVAISQPRHINRLFENIGLTVRLQDSIIILGPATFADGWRETTSETILEWVKIRNRCDAVYEGEYEMVYLAPLTAIDDLPSNLSLRVALSKSEMANLTACQTSSIQPKLAVSKIVGYRRVNSAMMMLDCKLVVYDKDYNIPIKEVIWHGSGFESQS